MLLAAADMPPTPPTAAVAPAPASTTHVVFGLGNPEWLNLGIDGRTEHLGYALSIGTLVQANDVTGSLRYFPWEAGGLFLEAGGTLIRMSTLSDQSPQEWNPMAFVGAGYQLTLGRVVTTVGVGLNPMAVPSALNQPLFVTNARSVPRLLVQTGFAL
ncbi:MAG TPA: hypothetical protein V6D05_03715 [Stenomitos sp.]